MIFLEQFHKGKAGSNAYPLNQKGPPAKPKTAPNQGAVFGLAGGPGFEPGLTESESVVLPLDDPPIGGSADKAF